MDLSSFIEGKTEVRKLLLTPAFGGAVEVKE